MRPNQHIKYKDQRHTYMQVGSSSTATTIYQGEEFPVQMNWN